MNTMTLIKIGPRLQSRSSVFFMFAGGRKRGRVFNKLLKAQQCFLLMLELLSTGALKAQPVPHGPIKCLACLPQELSHLGHRIRQLLCFSFYNTVAFDAFFFLSP